MAAKKLTKRHIHFVGIGGIGVSALARWFLSQKWRVSGSDLAGSPLLRELQKGGIKAKIGHKKGNIGPKTSLVIRSQAVPLSSPEIREARRRHIPVHSYPEEIGELTKKYTTIAVAGAHGKSTTTALLSLMLREAKLDPTVIVGTKLREFKGKNFRAGGSPYLVLEADEYGKAFLHYFPAIAVVTNIDREHLEIYGGSLAEIKRNFLKFLGNILPGGAVVLNKDDANLFSLRRRIMDLARVKDYTVAWYSLRDKNAPRLARALRIFGTHNLSNALGAAAAARLLGAPEAAIMRAAGSYGGAWRRMEYRGRLQVTGCRLQLYDDYAHHPTEIRATLEAFKKQFPRSPIVCIFEPHHSKRLTALFPEFQHAFDLADVTLVLPLYKVAGREVSASTNYKNSEALVRAIQKRQPKKPIFYLADLKNIASALKVLLPSLSPAPHAANPILIMMGAGGIVEQTDKLLSKK